MYPGRSLAYDTLFRPDRTMQDIVYKLVPGLYKSKYKGKCMICSQSSISTGEQKRREEFYLERGETDPSELWTKA